MISVINVLCRQEEKCVWCSFFLVALDHDLEQWWQWSRWLLQSHKRGSRSFDATQGFSHPLLFWASLFLGPVVKVLLNHDVPGSRAGISHLWPQTPFSASYESVIAWNAGDHVHGLQGWWDAAWSSCFRRVSYTLASLCWVWWPGTLCTSAFKSLPWHLLMILCNIQHVSGPWFPLLWMRRQDNT